jgi:hypothetical protein
MVMLHGQAVWTYSMDKQQGQTAWTYSRDIQQGHAAWQCSLDMLLSMLHAPVLHVHAA